jgi:hypothetical protein
MVLKGRLAQLLTEGTSPLPRWLIKFDRQPQKDEEMYERVFGKLISAVEGDGDDDGGGGDDDGDDLPSNHSNSPSSSSQLRITKPQVGGSNNKHSGGTSSEGEAGDETKTKSLKTNITITDITDAASKKSVQFSESGAGSDYSSNPETGLEGERMSARDRVSAREARSRRRQSKIDEDLPLLECGGVIGEKRKIMPPANHSKKRQRPSEDGEVVKVKLLTGTLYLYRGQHRRAVFIRKV